MCIQSPDERNQIVDAGDATQSCPHDSRWKPGNARIKIFSFHDSGNTYCFQGGEADIAVIVTSRSNLRADVGFLKDYRRTNVSISRGRFSVIIIGDLTVSVLRKF